MTMQDLDEDALDTELDDLAALWTATQDTLPDVRGAYRRMRMKRWISGVFEIAACLGGVGLASFFAFESPNPFTLVLLIGTVGAVAFSFGVSWAEYSRMSSGAPQSTSGYVHALLEDARRRERLLELGRWPTHIIAAFVFAWMMWMITSHWEVYAAEPWRGIVGAGGALVILIGVYVTMAVHRRRIRDELAMMSTWEDV